MPLDDWQFWVVTVLAVAALAWLLRGIVPVPLLSRRYRQRRRERRVNLTVGGKSVR